MVNKSNDQIMINGKKYNIIETCATSALRKVYKVRDEQNVTYYIKEVKKASSTGSNELENNAAVILDEEAENNSNYFFQTEILAETETASYFRIITEAGDPLDRLREKWFKVLSGDAYLSAVVNLMIEVAEALEYMHNEKGLLHIDLKPQNIYAVGKGFDRKIKLLDLGSALPIDKLKDGDDGSAYIETTSEYQSLFLVMMSSCNNSVLLRRMLRELSVRDDIFALSCVMAYMLVGEPHAKEIMISGCNRYCLNKMNEILVSAQQGHFFTACGETFECGVYGNVSLIKNDLEILSDALHNKGLSKTIMLKKGREYFDGLLRNRRRRIIPEMIPRLHAENCDSGDINTVDKLCEVLKSEKHDISIFCQGGSGKTFLLYDVFRKLSDAEDPSVIPIYLPLGNIGAGEKCVFDAIAEAYTGINKEDLADGMTKSQKLFDFMKTSDLRFAILADSLNETPATDPLLRGYAIENLNQLAQWENISVVMTSRYRELAVSDFEYYTLDPLDEVYLAECVEGYGSLNKTLRELLRVPFNLCLYLGLVDAPKRKQITNAVDLIQANIDEIRSKSHGTMALCESAFIFDCLFPILAYKMSKENAMVFTLSDAEEAAHTCCWLFIGAKYEFIRRMILNDVNAFVCRMSCFLRDYDLISFSDEEGTTFEISHENYRNWFSAKGWMITVERFKLFYQEYGDKLTMNTFAAPICMHSYLKELIATKSIEICEGKKESADKQYSSMLSGNALPQHGNYFDDLFNKTTRHMLHNEVAAKFNDLIINVLRSIMPEGVKNVFCQSFPIIRQNLSNLDLSLTWFTGASLYSCDFSYSIMNEDSFRAPPVSNMPDVIWNDDEKAVMLYNEGLIQCVSFNTGMKYERRILRFSAGCVFRNKIYILRNVKQIMSVFKYGSFESRYALEVYDSDTGELIASSMPGLWDGQLCYDSLQRWQIYEIFFDSDGFLHGIFDKGIISFRLLSSDSEIGAAPKLKRENVFFFHSRCDSKHQRYSINRWIGSGMRSVDNYQWQYCPASPFERFVMLDKTDIPQSVFPIAETDFVILKINMNNNENPIKEYGPYSRDQFEKYGRLLGVSVINDVISAVTGRDGKLNYVYFDLDMKKTDHPVDHACHLYAYYDGLPVVSYVEEKDAKVSGSFFVRDLAFSVSRSREFICTFADGILDVRRIKSLSGYESKRADDALEYNEPFLSVNCISSSASFSFGEQITQSSLELILSDTFPREKNRCYDLKAHRIKINTHNSPLPVALGSYIRQWDYTAERGYKINDLQSKIMKGTNISEAAITAVCRLGSQYVFISAQCRNEFELFPIIAIYDIKTGRCFIIEDCDVFTRVIDRSIWCNEIPQSGIDLPNLADNLDDLYVEGFPLVISNTVYELSINIKNESASIVRQTELYPNVWIEHCIFSNVQIAVRNSISDLLKRRGSTEEEYIQKILHNWNANNISEE